MLGCATVPPQEHAEHPTMPKARRSPWLITLLNLAGRLGGGYSGPQSPNFDGLRFRNLDAKPHHGFREFLKWQLERDRQLAWIEQPGAERRPETPAQVSGEELRVTYINHATLLIQHRGLNILTDPLWCERTSPFSFVGPKRLHPPGLALDELPPINLILVSHNHYDHLDVGSLGELARRFPQAKVVTGLGNAELIRACGFVDVHELDWWQSVQHKELTLHFTPAQHFSGRGIRDRDMTLWGGLWVETPSGSLFFAGDTGYGPHFRDIATRLGAPRLALLPIGAYEPRWFMEPQHMNPAEAVQAFQDLGAEQALGIHWGTFQLTNEAIEQPLRDLEAALEAAGIDPARFRAMRPGEVWQP